MVKRRGWCSAPCWRLSIPGLCSAQAAQAFEEVLGEPPSQPLPMLLARLEQAGASAGLPGQLRQLLARLEALPGPSQAPAGRDDAVPDLAAARDLERIRLSLPQVGCSHAACTTAKSAAEMSMPVKTCGQCMVAKYCSRECQRAARGVHKLECARLAKASKK